MSESIKTIRNPIYSICPYCEKVQFIVRDNEFSDGNKHEVQCDYCENKYYQQQKKTIENISSPDCALNDKFHHYIEFKGFLDGIVCERCGKHKERKVSDDTSNP